MYSDAQRLQLFEKLLKTTDEAKLIEVEKILDKPVNGEEKKTQSDFEGVKGKGDER